MTYAPLRLAGVAVVCVVLPDCSGCVQHAVPGPAVEHAAFAAQYLRQGDYELAEQRADLSIEYSGGTYAEPWNIKALIELHRGHRDLAREDVKRALSLKNDFAEAYNTLGTIEQLRHDDSHAIDAYSQATKLDPGYLAARRNRGLAYMRTNDTKARGDFLKCLEIDPSYCDCRDGLGALALNAKDWDEARGEYEKLTQICPSNAMAFYNLCVADLQKQDCESALDACTSALSLAQSCAECEHNLSEAYACIARKQGWSDKFFRAVRERPGDADGHFRMGTILEDQRLLPEARDEYRAAVILSVGRHTQALYRLARVTDNLGQSRQVVEACQRLLDTVRDSVMPEETRWCTDRVRQLQLK